MAGNSAQVTFAFLAKDLASGTIRGISKSFNNLKENARNLGGALKTGLRIGIGAVAAAATAAGAGIIYAVKQASDFNETLNKTRVVLGTASAEVEAFAKTASTSLGLSEAEALNAASTFAIFGKSANLSGDDLAGFSTQLTSLAADFGSFYNASNEEAITAIGAALRGETEPIRRFGVLLDDATLRQRAFAMGLIKTTKEALTPQNKVLAAQAEILASAKRTGSLGDFAATFGGSFPNQIKALRASFQNLTKDIGGAFLPGVMKVFKALQPALDSLFGDLRKGIPDLEKFVNKIADDLVKNLPGYIATAKREIPALIAKVEGFLKGVVGFGKEAAKFLGKDGAVTGGLALIGAKIGGLKGALSGVLSKAFSDFGFGPFQSLLLGTVSSAVIAGMTEGLVGAATQKLIAAFALKMKAASTPTPVPGVGTVPAAGGAGWLAALGGTAGLAVIAGAVLVTSAVVAATATLTNAIVKDKKTGLFNASVATGVTTTGPIDLFGTTAATLLPPGAVNSPNFWKSKDQLAAEANILRGGNVGTSYGAPNFTILLGATTVANAVVPIIAKNINSNPRGGR
jgi:hypothetical protein